MHDGRTLREIIIDSAKDIAGLAAISLFILAVAFIAMQAAPAHIPV